ncbi:MAG: hypothetical protein PHT40_04565 [Patescibacteria group bacterium]|nr:hypothetical protein [Patescibacteria group bacterium]
MSKSWKNFDPKNLPLGIIIQVREKADKKESVICCHDHEDMKLVRLADGTFRLECDKLGCNWKKVISLAAYEYREK